VNGGPLQDYSTYPTITFTVDNGYEFVAVFAKYVTFTVQVERYGAGGSLGAASGVQVSINGVTYTTGSDGKVSVQVQEGSTATVQILTTYFNSNWGRYTFYQWWDGSTANPRSFTVSSSTTVTARVYARARTCLYWGCPNRVLTYRQGYGSARGTLAWSGQLSSEYVCFDAALAGLGSCSVSGTVVKPTDNPITAYMSSGWWYNAVFGSP